MALAIASEAVTDWTAVAQNIIGESSIIDISANYNTVLQIQAALDTTTAHTGTRFLVQVSQQSSGDEDWQDFHELIALIGTATTDLIEDNPLSSGSTAIALTGHAYTDLGKWLLIEDSTLANSELVFQSAQSADVVTVLDGTTNEHAQNTPMYDVAMTEVISIPIGTGMRARLLVDNTYDADGSSLNYKVNVVETTGI